MENQSESIVYQNVLPWGSTQKLYLDERTADVFFVFGSLAENPVKVPAHKNILSSISEKFDAMFYGPSKTDDDIIMDNTPVSPEAFKEFLQFFYRHTVTLSMKYVAEVMDLSKEHMLHDCINACVSLCKDRLTVNNIWFGYSMAIIFEQKDLKIFCEKQINRNAYELFQTHNFLSCQPNWLRCILQSGSFRCDESIVFDGCIAWAKAACIRKGLDENNMQNIRSELGDLFYEIRFGDMALDKFTTRADLHKGFFSKEEFHDIIRMIASKDYHPPKFNRNARYHESIQQNNDLLLCDRIDETRVDVKYFGCSAGAIFGSNRSLYLKHIYCARLFNGGSNPTECLMQLNQFRAGHGIEKPINLYGCTVSLSALHETKIELPTPIFIKSDDKYEISIRFGINHGNDRCYKMCVPVWRKIPMRDGILITFYDRDADGESGFFSVPQEYGSQIELITKLGFEMPDDHSLFNMHENASKSLKKVAYDLI